MSAETRSNADLMNRPMRKMRLSPGRPQPPRPLITRAFDRRDERAPRMERPRPGERAPVHGKPRISAARGPAASAAERSRFTIKRRLAAP